MDPSDWSIVRSTALFSAMPSEAARALIGSLSARAYEKSTMLFHQGEPASAFYVILDGWVKIYRTTVDGLEVVLHVFRQGETFAEAAMFLGGTYPASAETVSPARLLRIDGDTFRARIHERPELAMAMLASASYQLKYLVEQIEQIRSRSAAQRIAQFVVQMAAGRTGTTVVELPFEKALLANRLGMKPESFSRALAKLRTIGITVEKDSIHVADIEALRAFAEITAGEEE